MKQSYKVFIEGRTNTEKFILYLKAFAPGLWSERALHQACTDMAYEALSSEQLQKFESEFKMIDEFNIAVDSNFQALCIVALLDDYDLNLIYRKVLKSAIAQCTYKQIQAAEAARLRYAVFSGKFEAKLQNNWGYFSPYVLLPRCGSKAYIKRVLPEAFDRYWLELSMAGFFSSTWASDKSVRKILEETKIAQCLADIEGSLKQHNFALLEHVLEGSGKVQELQNLVGCVSSFLSADYPGAIKVFESQKPRLEQGVIYDCYERSLIFSKRKPDHKKLEKLVVSGVSSVFLHLSRFIKFGDLPARTTACADELQAESRFESVLNTFLVKRKLTKEKLLLFQNQLEQLKVHDLRQYREWLSLFSKAGNSSYGEELEALNQHFPYPALCSFIEMPSVWQEGLNAIEKLFIEEGGAEFRLTWRLSVDGRYWDVIPYEQKRSGKTWSRGRAVPLKNLSELSYLTEQDRRIVDCVERESVVTWRNDEHTWTGESVLECLAGHDLIFDLDDPTRELNLECRELSLIVDEQQDVYEFRLPEQCFTGCDLEKINSSSYIFWKKPPEFERLRELLTEDGLRVPREAAERVKKIIGPMARKIKISTSLSEKIDGCKEVASDSSIRITATPYDEEGIHFKMEVRPLGNKAGAYVPGEGDERLVVKGVQCQRDLHKERELFEEVLGLAKGFGAIGPDGEGEVTDLEQALDCVEALRDADIEIFWPKQKFAVQRSTGSLTLKVNKELDWFGVEGHLNFGDDIMELSRLLDEAAHKGQYIRLSDNNYLKLTKNLRQQVRHLQLLTSLGKDGVRKLPTLMQHEFADIFAGNEDVSVPNEWEENAGRVRRIFNKVYEVPEGLDADLRDYQLEGFQWMSRMIEWGAGVCLADDMGLGKTVQAIALLLARAQHGASLVVAPTSVCGNWLEEIQRFAPQLNPIIYGGGQRDKLFEKLEAYDVLICSYTLMQMDAEAIIEHEWNGLVLDEAQAIKNPQSRRSKTARSLKSTFKVATTGTPLENHLGELWSLFDFINPGHLGSLRHFGEEFRSPIEKEKNEQAVQRLQCRIKPFILRRLKRDVLGELPPRTEIELKVNLSGDERRFYDAVRAKAVSKIQGKKIDESLDKMTILAEITRLRRACCNTQLVDPESAIESSKLKVFMETVSGLLENKHKALVFSQFTSHLELVRKELDRQKISYTYLDGSTPAAKRNALVKDFQRGNSQLFLISLKAGGSGLNLTAADYVIHLDPWWNPAVEDQATDRAHRMGQTRPVTVYRLIMSDTIEEEILGLHKAKRNLADSLLSDTGVASSLSADDLFDLIKA